jgi:hypothetical protein
MKRKIILLSLVFSISAFAFFLVLTKEKKAILDLDGFYELTLRDPLFYSSFFDQKEFGKAIQGLAESESGLKKILTEGENLRGQILEETDFFPKQFLENLGLIDQLTNEFLETPSAELAVNLLETYDAAAENYLQSASSLIEILEKGEMEEEMVTIFVDSATSFEIVKNDLLTIKENGYRLKEAVAERENCLIGKTDCRQLITNRENIFSPVLSGENPPAGERMDFIKSTLPYASVEAEIKGPYQIESGCWQNSGFGHWLYLIYAEEDDRIMALPKLAEQNYYRKVTSPPQTREQEILLERGLEFISQIETTTYQCPDLTFYPQILVMDFIDKQTENGQVAGEYWETELEYKLLLENQFGLLAPAINTISHHLDTLIRYSQTYGSTPSLEYLLTARTAYSIFYFPFAKSIWRLDKELQYFLPEEEKLTAEIKKAHLTIDELRNLGYADKQIKNFHSAPQEIF